MNYFRIYGQWYYSKDRLGMEPILARYQADLIYHVAPATSEVTVTKCREQGHDFAPVPTHRELMQIRLQAEPLPDKAVLRYMKQLGKPWCMS